MKKLFLVLLGLVLGVFALACFTRWDIVTTPLGALLAFGAYAALRKAARLSPAPAGADERPWPKPPAS